MPNEERMRALTLKPHWAHAVAHFGKRIENRTTYYPYKLHGARIAIHAGASLPRGWEDALLAAGSSTGLAYGDVHDAEPRCRAIVATAVLCAADYGPASECPDWGEPGSWWWRLADVRTLVRPVHVQRGQLGLWRLDEETERKVIEAEYA